MRAVEEEEGSRESCSEICGRGRQRIPKVEVFGEEALVEVGVKEMEEGEGRVPRKRKIAEGFSLDRLD